MKTILFFLITFILISCKDDLPTEEVKSPEYVKPQLNESFDLKIGESAYIDGGKFIFTFDSVFSDNRCPEGMDCDDSGDAVVDIKISESHFLFHTNLWPRSMTFSVYQVNLLYLSPYPKQTVPISNNSYIAKFIVSKVILG
jgi:hypothetical protein